MIARIRFLLLVALLQSSLAVVTAAGREFVPFETNSLRESEWEAVKDFLQREGVRLGFRIEDEMLSGWGGAQPKTVDEAWALIRRWLVGSARVDMDGDGRQELLTYVGHGIYCGSAGCHGFIFSRDANGSWQMVARLTTSREDGFCLSDMAPRGYRAANFFGEALWWTGSGYEGLCVRDCESLGISTPETHDLRMAFLAEDACFKSSDATGERRPLLTTDVTDEDWPFVRSYFALRYMHLDEDSTAELFMSLAHLRTKEEAWSHIRNRVLASGYDDLDGDGIDELVVFLGHSCGTIGCQTQIFSRKDGGWEPVRVRLRADDGPDLCVSDPGPDGYPIVYSGRDAVWWTGREYERACLVDCGDETGDGGEPPEVPREALLHLVRQGCGESK